MILIGDSGVGKTGSMVSLVKAGYRLKYLDLDNGLDALRQWIGKECPEKIDAVDYETIRDSIRSTSSGPTVSAKGYIEAVKLLDKWTDGSLPAAGGDMEVFVLDSTTTFGNMAYEWAKGLSPTAKDPRQWYFAAQQSFQNVIAMLTSDDFKANVIVVAHVNYKQLSEGVEKGYPTAVGSALGPTIPKYFNNMIQLETIGTGRNAKRQFSTMPTGLIDVKNPAPFKIEATYPIGTGLAEIFRLLKAA